MATWIVTHNVSEATYWDFGTSVVGGRHNPLTTKALATRFGMPDARTTTTSP
jgi:hypothetical protein